MIVIGASTPVGWVWLNGHGPNHCEYDRVVECAECGQAFGTEGAHTPLGPQPTEQVNNLP